MADFTLTYADIKSAVAGDRIPTTQPIAQWVGAAYTDIWHAAKWTFKKVSRQAFTVTTATPTMPPDFAEIVALYDDQGYELKQLAEIEFERNYTEQTATTGRPSTYTVVNRQILLWPTPDTSYTLKISYKRKLATRTGAGAVQAGYFAQDSDIPLWDDHHYIIVVRAQLLGLKQLSDPTASMLEDEFGRLLDAMQNEYVENLPRGYQLPAWR